jgi:hypothetical protein
MSKNWIDEERFNKSTTALVGADTAGKKKKSSAGKKKVEAN